MKMQKSASVLVRESKKLILVLQRSLSSTHFSGIWEFPGGKVDEGQLVSEAACREVAEETGLEIQGLPEDPMKTVITSQNEVEYSMYTWDSSEERPMVVLSSEHRAYRWVRPVELRELATRGLILAPHLEFFEWDWLRGQIQRYGVEEPAYRTYSMVLLEVLNKLRSRWAPLAIVQARSKTPDSFAEKCLRKAHKYDDPVLQLTDLCGGRVIATTEREVEVLCRQIHQIFDIVEEDDVRNRLQPDAFGYLSVHFLVKIPNGKQEILGVDIPKEIRHRVAEVQIRTLLQHAHSEVTHDRLYKSGFKSPLHFGREAARVAASLEGADSEFDRFVGQLDDYVGEYAAHMEPVERRRRVEDQLLLMEFESSPGKKAKLALNIAHLARPAWDWEMVREVLDEFINTDAACRDAIRVEVGNALCRMAQSDVAHEEFGRGVDLLRSVARPEDSLEEALECDERRLRSTALGCLGRALTQVPGQRDLARRSLDGAVYLDPNNPYHLCSLVELDIISTGRREHLDLLAPSLRHAARCCEEHIRARIEVNRAWFALVKIRLFLGEESKAFAALCHAARTAENARPVTAMVRSLSQLKDAVGSKLPGVDTLECSANLFVEAALLKLGKSASQIRSMWPVESRVSIRPDLPVLIVAGSTGAIEPARLSRYGAHLRAMSKGGAFQILTGGTLAGVCGLVAELATEAEADDAIMLERVLGYIPEAQPLGVQLAGAPVELVQTLGNSDFSIREPLQMWTDILSAKVTPENVFLLCLGGGEISSAELALAWALGANAAVIDDGSHAANQFKELLDWAGRGSGKGMLLPDDVATLSAIWSSCLSFESRGWNQQWEAPGRAVHQAYLEDHSRLATEPNLLPWDLLPSSLTHSSRHQAFYSVEILRKEGFVVEESKLPVEGIPVFELPEDERIERMAEAEHGRWNAERLRDGWQRGESKDVAQKISPFLVPWDELPEEMKEYDRRAVHDWPRILATAGWEVVAPSDGSTC